jgi:hypothetical protein
MRTSALRLSLSLGVTLVVSSGLSQVALRVSDHSDAILGTNPGPPAQL